MKIDLWKAVAVGLSVAGMLLGVGRYIGHIEATLEKIGPMEMRLGNLEQLEHDLGAKERYIHGNFELPDGAK